MCSNLLFTIAAAACLAVSGCGGSSAVVDATPTQESALSQSGYLIGPGDSLTIFVWDHADLSTSVQVRPDGRISTPLVEDLQAAGKPPTVLARDIEAVLGQYIRSPVATVIVEGFVGEAQQQIRVVGQAVQPRALQYRQGITLLDVMIEVGGLAEFAAGNRAILVRTVNGNQTEIRVRLEDLLNKGRVEENVALLPGDVLVIPQSAF